MVDPEVANRLVRRVTTDHPEVDRATARRIVGQAAAFIAASGQQPGRSLSPSELVDYGWHAFILHTVDYAVQLDPVRRPRPGDRVARPARRRARPGPGLRQGR
ncbi:hypothetical protein ACFZBP_17745 [Streptomyces sp. NPDC008086]|uniref:hypothetical protein n=1 Tax=Streptomyces sp. NPDC008086 TaxID=3364807 RepID=UPI0036E55B40